MRRQLVTLALILLSTGLVLGYGSGTTLSTHYKLTSILFSASAPANLQDLTPDPKVYPDLYKFRQAIIDGSNSEQSHHDPADANTEYWYGNEGQWENLVRASQYPAKLFRDAYTSIGYTVHLTEDSTIPAHDRVIFHGYPALYYVAPGGPLLDASKYTAVRSDGLEYVAGDYDLATLPVLTIPLATFHFSQGAWSNTPQYYNSSSTTCHNIQRILWLCDGEAAASDHRDDYGALCSAPDRRSWGTYSFPTARGCDYPQVGVDLDWYPRHLYPTSSVEAPQTAHDMGRAALYLAIRSSSEVLERFSKTLPPVVTPAPSSITDSFARGTPATFVVQVQENRTQGVSLIVRDAAKRLNIRATIFAPNLPSRTIDLDGSLRIPLTSHMDTDLTTLPWADSVTISWDGALAGGAGTIGAGDRTLEVLVQDEDGNVGDAVVQVHSTAGPVITAQPASVTVAAGQTATFQVGASGAAPLAYQWARNGAAISGATSASYTTPATTIADSGVSFSATVSNPGGRAVSSGATLTVNPPAGQDLVVNGGFESGPAGWSGDTAIIGAFTRQPPYAGAADAFFLGTGRTLSQALQQTVTIPSAATSAVLTLQLHIDTAETTTSKAYDKLTVQLLNSSGGALKTLATYSNLNAASGYVVRTFDLSSYNGKTIRLNFRATEDGSKQTSFVVDNVSVVVR